jgi:hypothetical protein
MIQSLKSVLAVVKIQEIEKYLIKKIIKLSEHENLCSQECLIILIQEVISHFKTED